ncbi:MAG TPA: hypothetical protein VEI03_23950 [Stellaceae bacterium]|nr:hypothetical protein [Stellaceae bacterium]
MPAPSPEKVVANIRRTLHASISHYATLFADALDGDVQDELVELGSLLGLGWPSAISPSDQREQQIRLEILLETLTQAACEDRQATRERREAARMSGADADGVPVVTTAVDRWLDRWLSGKEANRLP